MTPNREVSISTSLLYHGFSIRGYKYVRTEYRGGEVIFTIGQNLKSCRREACGSHDVRPRGHVERRCRSLPIGSRVTSVVLPIPRVECQACGVVRQGRGLLRRSAAELHQGLRTVRPGGSDDFGRSPCIVRLREIEKKGSRIRA